MQKRQNGFSIIEIVTTLALIAILVGAVFFVFYKQHSSSLSAEDIAKKFDCNRITEDVRETDVFCGNPKFYNDPTSVTKDDYAKYYDCDERLQGKPPAESAKTTDPGYYNAYYNCKDAAKLEGLRQDFIKKLQELKAENG